MTVKSDPAISIAVVSAATLTLAYMAGELPRPDSVLFDCCNRRKIRAWRLSTLRAWNPQVADRCAAILQALDSTPLQAA